VTVVTKWLAAVAAALVLAPTVAAKEQPVLGLVWNERSALLARLDPATLRPFGRKLDLGRFGQGWSFSANRSRLALGSTFQASMARPPAVQIVDTSRLASIGVVPLPGELGTVQATAWVGERLLAVVGRSNGHVVVSIDPVGLRVVSKRVVAGRIMGGAVSPRGFALLVTPVNTIGTARVVVVDGSLSVRTIRLSRITAGSQWSQNGNDVVGRIQHPAFAVTPDGARALVLGDGPLADVDLRSGSVRYDEVRTVARAAKRAEGWVRYAHWLDRARLLVTGWNFHASGEPFQTPIGAWLVDTGSRTRRPIDEQAAFATPARGLVLTYSSSTGGGAGSGPGLRALGIDGRELYRVLEGQWIGYVQVAERAALARLAGPAAVAKVVELATGRVTRTIHGSPPDLLVGRAQPIW
jgi:hypothetical protein